MVSRPCHTSNFSKTVFRKFYVVHYLISWPIYSTKFWIIIQEEYFYVLNFSLFKQELPESIIIFYKVECWTVINFHPLIAMVQWPFFLIKFTFKCKFWYDLCQHSGTFSVKCRYSVYSGNLFYPIAFFLERFKFKPKY